MEEIKTKRCSRCGEVKPMTEFHNKKTSKDGKQEYCKSCRRAIAKAWYEKKTSKQITPPPHLQESPFVGIPPRVIIAEIRQRLNYLRDTGWIFEGSLKYIKEEIIKL